MMGGQGKLFIFASKTHARSPGGCRLQIPVAIFCCARAFEANPPAAAAIAASDWDICSHGYRWTNHAGLPEAEERRQIAAAVELIKQTTGKTPLGWYCRYAPSENTRRLLVEHGGFLYDSDTYNDDAALLGAGGRPPASGRAVWAPGPQSVPAMIFSRPTIAA
jgi:peptidoglycan/xylan/chitin deacetylase (PgdA/CDA1 family)